MSDFSEGGVHAVKHTFLHKVDVSHKEMLPLVILVLFKIWGDARIECRKSFPEYI